MASARPAWIAEVEEIRCRIRLVRDALREET
jgi:hypothetical protein